MNVRSRFSHAPIFLLALVSFLLPGEAARAVTYLDITEICILDGNGSSNDLHPCLKEAFPGDGGTLSSSAEDPHYPNYEHFKASRWRVSGFDDVVKMSRVPDAALQDNGGLYNFATSTYFRPTFFRSGHPAAAMAGVRVNAGVTAVTPIDAFGMCRYIRNLSPNNIFVPLRTYTEWKAFLDNLPENVYADRCSLPCPGDCSYYYGPTSARFDLGDENDGDPVGSSSNYFSMELPYAREGTTWPSSGSDGILNVHTFKYKCYDMEVVVNKDLCLKKEKRLNASGLEEEYCAKYATQCVKNWHSWQEVWKVNPLTAGASQDGDSSGLSVRTNKGWIFPSPLTSRISGGTRPEACETDAEHDYIESGNECKSDGTPKIKPPSTPSATPVSVCGW